MSYKTLHIVDIPNGICITLNRVEKHNTISSIMISELQHMLDQLEKNVSYKIVVLKGQPGFFCTGMDFTEITQTHFKHEEAIQWSSQYMQLLKKLALLSKIVIAEVDGQVMAGGVGLVAACDYVIATSRSEFSLSEALWGLLPANVLPYLIRRVGFQHAYIMALTTQTISAQTAFAMRLVDEISEDPQHVIAHLTQRFVRIDQETIRDIKQYFRKLWLINENIEQMAVNELARLIQESRVQNNIKNFLENGKFPWENPK